MSWHPFEDSIAIAATNNVSSHPLPHFPSVASKTTLTCCQLFVFSACRCPVPCDTDG